jgi:hypothetical protein
MYLYSDDYDIFPWATHDEGLKFLHLIITVPFPLLFSYLFKVFIKGKLGIHGKLINFLPLICLGFISIFMLFNTNLDQTRLKIGFGLSIVLFIFTFYLMLFDFLKKENES